MTNAPQIISSQGLDEIISGSDDFPGAKVAAAMLKPFLQQVSTAVPGTHADKIKPVFAQVPQETMAMVNATIMQMQAQMFALQNLAIQHPEQKDDIMKQHGEAKKIAGTLARDLATVCEFSEPAPAQGRGGRG